MEFGELWPWLTDPVNWSGPNGIPVRVGQHLAVSGISALIAIVVALPIGLVIGHRRRGELAAVTVANLGRAIPSLAIISLAFLVVAEAWPTLAFSYVPPATALVLLGIAPILTNAYVGVQQTDPDTVEAARGMGLTPRQVLTRLELPLAAPLIMAGIRTAVVQIVATATLWALVGGEGLGRYIVNGFAQNNDGMVLGGAVLVAVLAVVTELLFGGVERLVTPRTTSRGRPRRRVRIGAAVTEPVGQGA